MIRQSSSLWEKHAESVLASKNFIVISARIFIRSDFTDALTQRIACQKLSHHGCCLSALFICIILFIFFSPLQLVILPCAARRLPLFYLHASSKINLEKVFPDRDWIWFIVYFCLATIIQRSIFMRCPQGSVGRMLLRHDTIKSANWSGRHLDSGLQITRKNRWYER